jgi:hypothetical protein
MRALRLALALSFALVMPNCRCGTPPVETPDGSTAAVSPPVKQVVSASGQMKGGGGLTLDVQLGGAVGQGQAPAAGTTVAPESAVHR